MDGVIKRSDSVNEFIGAFLVIILYSFFAIRWGFRFVDGRWAWLEKSNNRIAKIIISIVLGYFLTGLYFVLWCVKMIIYVIPKWLS